jgi:hypothetical protein
LLVKGLVMKPLTDPAESRRGAAVAAIVVGVFLGTLFLKLNPTGARDRGRSIWRRGNPPRG